MEASFVEEFGPIRASLRLTATNKKSRINIKCSIYRNKPWIDLNIELIFVGRFSILKIFVPVLNSYTRKDSLAKGYTVRDQDMQESCFMDWTFIENINFTERNTRMNIISPDCFSISGIPRLLGFTLVRTPVFAWHD